LYENFSLNMAYISDSEVTTVLSVGNKSVAVICRVYKSRMW
jgi:hypothetical protein